MRVPDHAVLKSVTRLNLQRHINWSSIDGIGIDPKDNAEDGDEGLDQDTARRLQTCTQLLKYLPALRYLTLEISSMNLLIAPEDDNVWQRKPAEIIRRKYPVEALLRCESLRSFTCICTNTVPFILQGMVMASEEAFWEPLIT